MPLLAGHGAIDDGHMLLAVVRMLLRAATAVVIAAVRRIVRGPLVPGWSWRVELRRAAISAVVESAIRSSKAERWSDVDVGVPLPRRLRSRIEVDPASEGGVPGEWLLSRDAPSGGPVLLYFHGGGYVVGRPSMERPFIARIVHAVDGRCFSVDYRLAPRHRFPAAVDDALAAYRGVVEGGADPSRIVVLGDSAGGGLALALLLRIHDEGIAQPAGGVLVSPWLDLTHSGSTVVTNAATDYLPTATGRAASAYLGDADPRDRYASPLFADLRGLPPLLVLAGGAEMLLADSTRLAERAVAAGVDITLHVEPDMYHVWPAVLPRHAASARALVLIAGWVGCVIDDSKAPR